MASSLSQICVLCSTLKMSGIPLEIEKNIQAMKISLAFTGAANQRFKSLMAPQLQLRSDQPPSLFFVSFFVEFYHDRGIEWRGIFYPRHLALLQPPTTHLPCILRRFWHTIACSHGFFLAFLKWRHKQNSTHSLLFLGRERGKRIIIQTLKIHTKLAKIATMIIFSQ